MGVEAFDLQALALRRVAPAAQVFARAARRPEGSAGLLAFLHRRPAAWAPR